MVDDRAATNMRMYRPDKARRIWAGVVGAVSASA
jgi:hypothetical protein